MTSTATTKMSPLDQLAWMLKARRQARRIRQLKAALADACGGIASALVTIQELRERLAVAEGINTSHEEVLRRLLHEREQALHQSWEA